MSNIVKYTNRYNDEFTFEVNERGNIDWKGNFKYCRFGMPNDYSKAWEVFQKEYGGLDYEEFKSSVHTYDEVKREYVFKDLLPLITSKKDVINMVDPSGGPYLTEGTNMKSFGIDGIIKEFKHQKDGYEIILKK